MDGYNAIYNLQGHEPQNATIIFLKDKLSIGLKDEFGNPKVVYWFFDKIVREEFRKAGRVVVRHEGYPAQTIEVSHKEFAEKLDHHLREKNVYYDDLVGGNILSRLRITPVRKNGFIDYMKSIGKLGGQNKVPRLSNDRIIADALTKCLNNK